MVRRAVGRLGSGRSDTDEAWERAETLLKDSITADQLSTYTRHGYIEVPSRLYPGRKYRIDGWRPVAIFGPSGDFQGAICLRPREHLPSPDVIVAHKLYIEGAEERFLETGNWLSPAWRPTTAAPTVILLVFLLGPWILNLARLGPAGLAFAVGGLLAVGLWLIRRVDRQRRSRSALVRGA